MHLWSNEMKTFKEYIVEGITEGGVFEEVIVSAWNGKPGPKTSTIAPDAGEKIVKYLKTQNITGKTASKVQTNEVDVTSDWAKFWLPKSVPGATKTPKTDILIGTNRISVKMGPAQLMSGGPNESTATFYAALNSMYKSGIDVNADLFQEIWAKLSALTKGAIAKDNVRNELKKGKDAFLIQANKVNHDVQVLMQKSFDNEDFRLSFVREAMTGEIKFGLKSSGYAEYVLSSDPNGDVSHLYKSANEAFLNKVAQKAKVQVRFKSKSVKSKNVKTGEYKYWSVIGIGIKKLEEEFEHYDGTLLTENIITGIIQRFKNFLVDLFQQVYEYLKGGLKQIIEFFDFEPQITLNNEIDFSGV
jgi:hypothetical protein